MSRLPWIKVAVVLPGHPKLQALEKRLGLEDALGVMCRLWCWAATYDPTGEFPATACGGMEKVALGPCNAVTVEGVTSVTGALVDAGWLDPLDGGERYRVHDWDEFQSAHADKAERERAQVRERVRKLRNRKRNAIQALPVTVAVTRYESVTCNGVTAEREREKEKKPTSTNVEVCGEAKDASPPTLSLPLSPVVAVLPCVGRGAKQFAVTECQVEEWAKDFPGVDVRRAVLAASAWTKANPDKRKTHRGMPAFLVRWLTREQDHGSRNGADKPRRTVAPISDWSDPQAASEKL